MRPLHPAIAFLIAGGFIVALATLPQRAGSTWFGQIAGAGDVVTQQRAVAPFERVAVNGSTDVDVRVGGAQSVAVEAQPNIAELIDTTVHDGRLVVSSHESFTTHRRVMVHVTVPNLAALAIHGSADVTIDAARGPSLDLSTYGSGDIAASGDVERLHYDSSGSGNARLVRLRAREATVRIRGSGDARLHVTETLDVEISGSGDVTYIGAPRVLRQVVHGSGSVSAAGGE